MSTKSTVNKRNDMLEDEIIANDSSSTQISAVECVKLLCVKLCESLFVKLIILMLSLYFGGLMWFFYNHSSTWSQLWHLCHESSKEFISNEYLFIYNNKYFTNSVEINNNNNNNNIQNIHKQNNIIFKNKCDSRDDILTCEMERQHTQQQEVLWSKTNKNRNNCMNSIRDENYEKINKISFKLIEKHKHNTLNELLFEIQNLNIYFDMSLSMELNINEIKTEFFNEYNNCELRALKYLTDFSPILGFHVLCFYNFISYKQSLVIAYQHGYNKKTIPSIPYKNRKKCMIRNIKNGTYYITNECEIKYTLSSQSNPKFILISLGNNNNNNNNNNNITILRKHLQNNLINDIGSYDEYTIEGYDIFNILSSDDINNNIRINKSDSDSDSDSDENINGNMPTKSPETEKLYDKLELKRKIIIDNIGKENIISEYKKNPFSLYYPNGQSINYISFEEGNNYPFDGSIIFLFEGGRFIWPGIHIGHIINLGIGPNILLKTINMRPLIFEIIGLITGGEVEYIKNKSLYRFNRSEVGLNEEKKVSESRTCESAWLFGEQDIIVNSLKNRCQKILQIPKNHMEDMEVVRYKKGQRFDMHYDAFQQHDANSKQSQILLHGGFKNRIATILYYLSNINKNNYNNNYKYGHTIFPRYDKNIEWDGNGVEKYYSNNNNNNNNNNNTNNNNSLMQKCSNNGYDNGLKIKPQNGKTILFYNMLPNGELDPAALHGGCSLKYGQKWAANQWVWNRPFNQ